MLVSLDTSLSIVDRQHAVGETARQALALVGPKQSRLGPRML